MSLEIRQTDEYTKKNHKFIVEPDLKNALLAQHMLRANEIKYFMETESISVIESFFDHVIRHDIAIERKDFLANFSLRLPESQMRNFFTKDDTDANDMKIFKEKPIGEIENGIHGEDKSEKYKQATIFDFFDAVDKALLEYNIDWKQIHEDRFAQGGSVTDISKKLYPVYIALRKQGYNHNDLTG